MQITVRRDNRTVHQWPDVPREDDVRQALQVRIAEARTLWRAMDELENGSDEYPSADDCLDNVALTVLARGKHIDQMSDADFALIGAHMAQWFEKHALQPIARAEQATVGQRLEDEAAEREWRAA